MAKKPIESIGVITSVALAVQLACLPTTASAQGTDSADSMVLDEILVTAQRREQNIQDVPISVTAISGDLLSGGGVLDVSRLKLLVPGMNFGQTGAYAHIAVRGARTEAIQVNTQPIISNYIDGIYRSGTEQFLGPFVDLDRLEVLRGPQGTLFGRNSYGGAVVLHSNKPSQEFDTSLQVTGGDYSRLDVEGMINFPMTESISARIAAAHFEHDGYVENTFDGSAGGISGQTSGDDIDDRDADYIRGALLFEFENSSLILRGEYYDQGGNGSGDFAGSLAGSINAIGNGTPGTGAFAAFHIDGDIFEVNQPFNTGDGCGSYGNITSLLDANGDCPIDLDPARAAAIANDPYLIATDAPYFLDAEQTTISIHYDADFSWASMTALAAYTDNENFRGSDGDQGIGAAYLSGEIVTRETTQVEVHFVDNGEGSVDWLVGAFYLDEDNQDNFFFNSDPLGDGFQFTCITFRGVKSESLAVFGQVTFPLGDRTRLTVGARYSDEEVDGTINGTGGSYFTQPIPRDFRDINIETGEFSFMAPPILVSETFDPLTWRLALDHSLSDDQMIYGSIATGYSSGGFNSVEHPIKGGFTFDDSEMIAYEVGYKATLLDGSMTLNIAAFYNDFQDFMAEPGVVLATGSVIVLADIGGDAESTGIDLELDWIPTENLLVNLRGSWLNAEYGDFSTGLGGTLTSAGSLGETFPSIGTAEIPAGDPVTFVNLKGRQIAFSPDFTLGLTVAYDANLGDAGTLTSSVGFFYSDSYQASDQGYLHALQDSYTQTDVRLTWTSENGRFNITGFVQNIEDEAVVSRGNVFGATLNTQQYAPPRIVGVSVGYNYR